MRTGFQTSGSPFFLLPLLIPVCLYAETLKDDRRDSMREIMSA